MRTNRTLVGHSVVYSSGTLIVHGDLVLIEPGVAWLLLGLTPTGYPFIPPARVEHVADCGLCQSSEDAHFALLGATPSSRKEIAR